MNEGSHITKIDRGRVTIPKEVRTGVLDDDGYAIMECSQEDNEIVVRLTPATVQPKDE